MTQRGSKADWISIELIERNITECNLGDTVVRAPPEDTDPAGSAGILQNLRIKVEEIGGHWKTKSETRRERHERKEDTPPGIYFYPGQSFIEIFTHSAELPAYVGITAILVYSLKQSVLQWIKNRGTRWVKIRVGQQTIELHGETDVQKVADALAQHPALKAPLERTDANLQSNRLPRKKTRAQSKRITGKDKARKKPGPKQERTKQTKGRGKK
jgi:hypothetical protein